MKLLLKIISFILVLSVTALSFSGCNSANKNAVIYYEASVIPTTLDPQLASNDTELIMVRNTFEGLMRVDSDGNIVPGVAKSYTYENSEYTFYIDEKAAWSDGVPVTADDFVFAFRRAVDPNTKSPYAGKLNSILNAKYILSGDIGSENLGVKAKGPNTLVITLENSDDQFLYKLTTSVCMPCREDFFNSCQGQYGLSADKILTNGSYKLTKWNKEDFAARLYRNEKYYGNFTAKNSAVFISYNPDKDNLEKLSKSSVDVALIKMNQMEDSTAAGLNNAQFQNVVWVMEISDSMPYNLRKALFHSFDRSVYAGDLGVGFNAAYSLFPSSVSNENLDYIGIPTYDLELAKELYSEALKNYKDKKLPSTTLVYYNSEEMKLPLNDIVGHWQNNLGAYLNISPMDSVSEIKNTITGKENYIAVYPVTITDRDASVFCYQLGYNYSNAAVKTLNAIQSNILSQYKFMPIAFENSVTGYSGDIIDFNFTMGNGHIDFAYVTKK